MGPNQDDDELRTLMDRMARLESELAEVRSVAESLATNAVERPPRTTTAPPATDAPTATPEVSDQLADRRQLLRRVGTVAAGAVAGSAALAVTQAPPAAAADFDFLKIGVINSGDFSTQLTGSHFRVTNDTTAIAGQTSGGAGDRGVQGIATNDGVGVFASSVDGAPLHISNGSQVIPPQAGTWIGGQFLVAGSHLYFCYFGGVGPQSKWARLSATFVPLAAPARIYDSRPGVAPLFVTKGKLDNHQERVIDPKLNQAVPQGASAVVVNLTATDTNPGGFLSAFKNGVAWPGTSSVNWFQPGSTVANQCTVAVDGTAQFKVRCEGAGGAHFLVDVVGYYL